LVIGYRRFKGRDGGVKGCNIKIDAEKINFKYGNLIRLTQNDVQ
jgi:hypothetical protein